MKQLIYTPPLAYVPAPSRYLTAAVQQDLVNAGFASAEALFNGDAGALDGFIADALSRSKRTSAAGYCALRAGLFHLSRLLWNVQERGIATISPRPPTPWDFLYRAATDEDAIFAADCGKRLIDVTHALRARLPGICVQYATEPAAEKPQPPADVPPKPEDADRVQRIEIVSMPSQKVAITDMPKPGRLTVDVEAWPAMTTETVVSRHPNSDEITKTIATSRMTDRRG